MGRKLLDISAQTMTDAEKLELATKAFKAQGARLATLMQRQQADGAPKAEVEATLKEWTAWAGKATSLQAQAQEVTKTVSPAVVRVACIVASASRGVPGHAGMGSRATGAPAAALV
jgi:hypothetical protein